MQLIYIIGIMTSHLTKHGRRKSTNTLVSSDGRKFQTPQPCSPSPHFHVSSTSNRGAPSPHFSVCLPTSLRLTFPPLSCSGFWFTHRRGGTGGGGIAVGCWWSGGWIVGMVVVGEWVSGRWVIGGQCL